MIHMLSYAKRGLNSINTRRAILHDEKRYPNPMTYDPARWLDAKGTTKILDDPDGLLDPWTVNFGYGRRVCPGIAFADSELWIMAATVLWLFKISPKIDSASGKPRIPVPAWTGNTVR